MSTYLLDSFAAFLFSVRRTEFLILIRQLYMCVCCMVLLYSFACVCVCACSFVYLDVDVVALAAHFMPRLTAKCRRFLQPTATAAAAAGPDAGAGEEVL